MSNEWYVWSAHIFQCTHTHTHTRLDVCAINLDIVLMKLFCVLMIGLMKLICVLMKDEFQILFKCKKKKKKKMMG